MILPADSRDCDAKKQSDLDIALSVNMYHPDGFLSQNAILVILGM